MRLYMFPVVGIAIMTLVISDDPCDTIKYLNDWKRSVAFTTETMMICDNLLIEDWYRVTSGSGERMPTECPSGGFRCNTGRPIWLSSEGVEDGEELFPAVGHNVTRTAYSSNYDGSCDYDTFTIQIKGCHGYLVYYLKPVSGCTSAYCFGDQLPCPDGKSSENGFTPDCGAFPNVTVRPYVTTQLQETEGKNENDIDFIYNKATFECHADDLQDNYEYEIRWYINDLEIKEAQYTSISKSDVNGGTGRLLEETWASQFRPNMIVNCSMKVRGGGYDSPGPEQQSEAFFAGIKIEQKEFAVKEKEVMLVPVRLTIPLSCEWPKNAPQDKIDRIKKDSCVLHLLTGIPQYQTDGEKCKDGISDDGLIFNSQYCGIEFTHTDWDKTVNLELTGTSDDIVNIKDRIVFLRLYNNPNILEPNRNALYMWNGIHLPDIKVAVQNSDSFTLGGRCRSQNDPHMETFDKKTWELQQTTYGAGEYIMYKHDRLPLQVNAYFTNCNGAALCNCGLAVRSGNSIFVANFCKTKYKGVPRYNKYIVQRLCDDQNLVVTESGNTITIVLSTGTKVELSHGQVYDFYGIHGIFIYASTLDWGLTKGLCGTFNNDHADDFTPIGELGPTDVTTFAKSWKIEGDIAELTLFDPEGKLKPAEYYGHQYCTCTVNDNVYPFGEPKYDCDLTSSMKTCRNTRIPNTVYTASCVNKVLTSKRSVAGQITKRSPDITGDDEHPPMYPMVSEPAMDNGIVEWKNGWTEDTAREYCTSNIHKSPAFGPCSQHVPVINGDSYIENCVLDIKIQGDTAWLKATLQNYANECVKIARKMEILTVTNSTTESGEEKPIYSIILESTCPENCSGNGHCINGECNCLDGFYGSSCSLDPTQPPQIEKLAFEGLCDSTIRPCEKFRIPGTDFINGSLTCKFKSFSVKQNNTIEMHDVFTYPGEYSSGFAMFCPLPPSRQKRSIDNDIIGSGYYISVSNNGQYFTEELTTIVYDSTCYDCNLTSLTCDELDTCPTKDTVLDTTKEPTNIIMIAGVSGAVVAILIISIVAVCMCKHLRPKKMYIRDYAMSMPTTGGQVARNAHFHTDNLFTPEAMQSQTILN